VTGHVFRIERFAVHDGPGIRTTVFLKGCPLRCWWCHSPESQSALPELMFRPERCIRCFKCIDACQLSAIAQIASVPVIEEAVCRRCGGCAEVCATGARTQAGRLMRADDVVRVVDQDVLFYDQSGGGVTFSGGEPLSQPEFLLEMLEGCRRKRLHTAVDTCGMADPDVVRRAAALTDLFLFDVKMIDEERHRRFTGVSNARILENLRVLADARASVLVRLPLVPGVNDAPADVEQVGRFVSALGLSRVDVLPYHRAGTGKYAALGREYRLADTTVPTIETDAAVRVLRECGLDAVAGGRP
jgi:pyruvate formate lyase activating enzyme